ncbi:MAG TPA: FAD-dependent oxidoreductase [Acidimicrobiia bacterium]|nr:FAD-dependent oxidoreductase [Acidimicrobiia bacterium]
MPSLFDPLTIGPVRARNRIFRAATSTKLAEYNAVSDALLAHYRLVALGGVGTIVTEGLRFHPSAIKSPGGVAVTEDVSIPGLAVWADTVHDEGALIVGQLNHSGRQHTSTKVPGGLIGPSPIACPRSGGIPHVMSVDEIADFVDRFGTAAWRLAAAGFDGIEVHCAQGHLLQQFLSPFSNERDDRYGGSPSNRARFTLEVLRRVRENVPATVAVGLRLGIDEFTPDGLSLELTIDFASQVTREGLVDYLSLSQGNFNTIDTHLPDRHYPQVPFAEHQARVKAAVSGVPVVACTRIVTPEQAEHIVSTGMADAVALSRALVVDPMWPQKAAEGKSETIRLCIGCNECWDGLHEGTSQLSCVHNAVAGRELALAHVTSAVVARHVLVVGGGPAGLEAARLAAGRGHRVTLLEREHAVGGTPARAAAIAGHTDLANVSRFLGPAVESAGVDVRTGVDADLATVIGLAPDVVVIATGATPIAKELPGDGSIRNHSGLPSLDEDLTGRRVVIVDEDGHYWAAQIAEDAADRGANVTVITRFFEPFRELPSVSRIAAIRRLDATETQFLPLHEVVRAGSSDLVVRHFESGRESVISGVSDVVWVGPQRANDQLADRLRAAGVSDVRVIGDALAPRRIKNAIYEGNAVGRAI